MQAYKVEKQFGRETTILFIAIGIASGYFFLGIFNALGALFFMFFFYIIRGVATPVLKNQINEITPSQIRATVLSIRSLIIRLAFAVLGPLLGWQADRAGLPAALIFGSVFFLVTGLASALFLIHASRQITRVTGPLGSEAGQDLSGP
ncbi:MAG: MFS transporter [Desulfobacteraceae bacterium]|nr:MFS transporter [Desulfobacteraceae bacterium]